MRSRARMRRVRRCTGVYAADTRGTYTTTQPLYTLYPRLYIIDISIPRRTLNPTTLNENKKYPIQGTLTNVPEIPKLHIQVQDQGNSNMQTYLLDCI